VRGLPADEGGSMRKRVVAVVLLLLLAVPVWAEYYKVNVRRLASNLYQDTYSGIYIKTRYCHEFAYGQDAILKYDRYDYDNLLIFDHGVTCDVEKVFR